MAQGLKIEKIADGLQHPRQLLVLPNGDVLVVEANSPGTAPVTTPKQLIAGWSGKSGKAGKGGNRITPLRRAGAGGQWQKYVFLEGAGLAVRRAAGGDYLYVANTGNIMRHRYVPGETRVADPGWSSPTRRTPSTTTGPRRCSPVPTGASSTWASVRTATSPNGAAIEYRRAAILEVDVASRGSRIYASGLRNPTGLQWEPVSGKLWTIVNERDEIGNDLVPDYLTSVRRAATAGPTATSASTWIRG